MNDQYKVIGSEESPYSVKVRSYFRFKGIDHEWMGRAQAGDLFAAHAKLPLVPLVVTPDETGLQDSTPLIETLEAQFPEPTINPSDPISRFVSILLEEFGDEWGNKWMFHFRWAREVDQIGCSRRLAAGNLSDADADADADEEQIEQAAATIRSRMVDRVWFVGSNEITAPQIEQSFADMLQLLDSHLADRPYLFGARPAFADFAMWGQIYNARRDHTPAEIISKSTTHVAPWIDRMLEPEIMGDFEPWENLQATLAPLLETQVAALFLPWSVANAKAIEAGSEEFDVELASGTWRQKPQKYHARSLAALRQKYAAVADDAGLRRVLDETGCLPYLS